MHPTRAYARWALAVACLLAATPAPAGSLEVGPTTIVFPEPGSTTVLYVNNYGTVPITVQVEPFDWSQPDGIDHLVPSNTLVASPPIASIAAQGRQTVRLRATAEPDQQEHSFRLLISELPDPMHHKDHSVQVLTQFSVPAFAGGQSADAIKLVWSAAADGHTLKLTAQNDGARHVKLQDVEVKGAGKATQTLGGLNYILAGSFRIWKTPCLGCVPGDQLRIEGTDEVSGVKFDDPIAIGR